MKKIDILILSALPASGKSEVRKAMLALGPEQCLKVFHMGPNVQLDDYPYVEAMREIDTVARGFGMDGPFFHADDRPFRDPWEWITLVELLNEDFHTLGDLDRMPAHPAKWLFERIDRAQLRAGAQRKLGNLPHDVERAIGRHLVPRARRVFEELAQQRRLYCEHGEKATIVIEFARGGPYGTNMPVQPPRGTLFSLSRLSPAILDNAALLNILVSPEESRRKNIERAVPPDGEENNTGIYHGVPMSVMLADYGLEDVSPLIIEGQLRIESHGRVFFLRASQFDNRKDKTTFLRTPQNEWPEHLVTSLHAELARAMDVLITD